MTMVLVGFAVVAARMPALRRLPPAMLAQSPWAAEALRELAAEAPARSAP